MGQNEDKKGENMLFAPNCSLGAVDMFSATRILMETNVNAGDPPLESDGSWLPTPSVQCAHMMARYPAGSVHYCIGGVTRIPSAAPTPSGCLRSSVEVGREAAVYLSHLPYCSYIAL